MDYYAHTISPYSNFRLNDLETLEDILSSGYLLSRRILKLNSDEALFNGMDYISLCDLSKEHESYSAYTVYARRSLSLLFDKNIEVIVPKYVMWDFGGNIWLVSEKMHELGLKGRYSDFSDEVQVKDKLSLEYLKGVSLSLSNIKRVHDENYIKYYLYLIKSMLTYHQYDVPIYNLDDGKTIDKMIKM